MLDEIELSNDGKKLFKISAAESASPVVILRKSATPIVDAPNEGRRSVVPAGVAPETVSLEQILAMQQNILQNNTEISPSTDSSKEEG
jgi:hypothetical protein